MTIKKSIYVIEHLEPKLFDWCLFEYEHISNLVGKDNLWFTNISDKKEAVKLKGLGKVFSKKISEIFKDLKVDKKEVCILDPEAKGLLNPGECKKEFGYFVFGGILGDYPPRKRTKEELTCFMSGFPTRNIGCEQMSTDNAVYTVFQIMNGKKFSELKFQDKVSIKVNEFENIDLPYRYNICFNNGKKKIFMSQKVIEYLKNKKGF